ncbi:DEAD/DEAH box helicase [Escherichia coli]|uniref:DEAD/DEAH box helicase n=1 Tax=Escherichia coli TaxID=562 RepID=UPI00203227C5|nr:DEAD/DEAH box helicase [Escherichia coli]
MIILVFSGPTSLGKSFLIKHAAVDLIENNKLIIFILPTKALLEEYLIDLKSILNEKGVKDINVSKSVSQVDKESKKYIGVYTRKI